MGARSTLVQSALVQESHEMELLNAREAEITRLEAELARAKDTVGVMLNVQHDLEEGLQQQVLDGAAALAAKDTEMRRLSEQLED